MGVVRRLVALVVGLLIALGHLAIPTGASTTAQADRAQGVPAVALNVSFAGVTVNLDHDGSGSRTMPPVTTPGLADSTTPVRDALEGRDATPGIRDATPGIHLRLNGELVAPNGLLDDAASAANGARLNSQLAAEEIADGHAFTKHVVEQGQFPGIRTRGQFADMVESVVTDYTDIAQL